MRYSRIHELALSGEAVEVRSLAQGPASKKLAKLPLRNVPAAKPAGVARIAAHAEKPTLLLVGTGERMDAAVRESLVRYGFAVESAASLAAVRAVLASAPDLVLLVGDAAQDGGTRVLRALASNSATSVVPVAVLSDDASLDRRVSAFRAGAVAVVPRLASVDAIAQRIVQLARELPDRPGQTSGTLGEATFDDLVDLVRRELRSGILSVEGAGEEPQRIVLGAGRPVSDAVKDFVEKLRPLVARAETVRFEFHEEPLGRMQLLDPESGPADLSVLRDLRVVVVDRDAGRADVLAQELRGGGAVVVVADARTEDLARVEALDPSVIVFDSVALEGPGFDLVRRVRQHPRLRWASLLIANWSELWPDPSMPPDMATLARRVRPLVEQDQELVSVAQRRDSFDTRLEIQGPIRLLRNLLSVGSTLHVTVRNPKALIEIDLAEGLCVGAIGTRPDGPPLEGTQAFAALLALGSGRVHVERRDHPAVANVMSPLDVTVAAALREEVPIKPSHPPPGEMIEPEVEDDDAAGPILAVPRESQVDLPRADAAGVTWASMTEDKPAFEHMKTSTDILGRTRALAEASAPGGDLERAAGRKAALLDVQAVEVRDAVEDETIPTMRPPAPNTPVREGAATVPRAPAYVPDVLAMREEEARAAGLPLPAVLFEIEEADLTSVPPTPVPRSGAASAKPSDREWGPDEAHAAGAGGAAPSERAVPLAPPLHTIAGDRPTAPVPVLPELLVESASERPPAPAMLEEPPGPPPPTIIVERRKWPSEPPDVARTRVWPYALAATVGVVLVSGGIALYLFVMNPAGGSATASASPQEPPSEASEATMATEMRVEPAPSMETASMEGMVEIAMEAGTATGTEMETAAEAEPETEMETAAEAEPETETGTGTEPETETGTEAATEPETGTEPETETGTEAETESGSGSGSGMLPIDPSRSAASLVREAERYVRDGDFNRAGPLFERALELSPNENHALIGVAQVLVHRRENPSRAVELAERAVRMRNRRAPYRVILGDALALAGRTQEARAEYNRALQIDPRNGDARRGLRALPD